MNGSGLPLPQFDTRGAPLPHRGARLLILDAARGPARSAAIYLHGRGASADDILSLHHELAVDGMLAIAPEANGNSWYPQRFIAPYELNRASVESAHALIASLIDQLDAQGIPPSRVALVGFSQGACLSLDHALRHPRRFGAIVALTGGAIGDADPAPAAPSDIAGTPVFLGANDPDPHIPYSRVEATARAMASAGAIVTLRRYPGRPHAVFEDEIAEARAMFQRAFG
jgi:predicted esterase